MRETKPEKVKRCYFCGAKNQLVKTRENPDGRWTIFHKSHCAIVIKNKETGKSEAETLYPGIDHGGYV